MVVHPMGRPHQPPLLARDPGQANLRESLEFQRKRNNLADEKNKGDKKIENGSIAVKPEQCLVGVVIAVLDWDRYGVERTDQPTLTAHIRALGGEIEFAQKGFDTRKNAVSFISKRNAKLE